jgi:hypothetical protein
MNQNSAMFFPIHALSMLVMPLCLVEKDRPGFSRDEGGESAASGRQSGHITGPDEGQPAAQQVHGRNQHGDLTRD